jgi:hypothetical protein
MTPESEHRARGEAGVGLLQLEELQHLYSVLLPEGRDELLQCLLVAAPRGGEAMIEVLEQTLLCGGVEKLLEGPLEADGEE